MRRGEIAALVVLLCLPVLVAALRRWWTVITRPFHSSDDLERRIAKGSVLFIFVACLAYAALAALASVLHGQPSLAVFSASIAWWLWEGVREVERRYHLLEVVEADKW